MWSYIDAWCGCELRIIQFCWIIIFLDIKKVFVLNLFKKTRTYNRQIYLMH